MMWEIICNKWAYLTSCLTTLPQSPYFPLIQLTLQGITGGIVVLAFTRLLDWWKQKQKLKRVLLLIAFEIESHILMLNILISTKRYPDKISYAEFKTEVWNKFQSELTSLDIPTLRQLCFYYNTIRNINNIMLSKKEMQLTTNEIKGLKATLKHAQSLDSALAEHIPR